MDDNRIFTLENHWGCARIAAHGAQLLNCTTADGKPLFWCEKNPDLSDGSAIRGGIPICWPWFGQHLTDPEQPMHGVVRLHRWQCQLLENTAAESRLILTGDFCGAQLQMEYRLNDGLELHLSFTNQTAAPIVYSGAFHSYFAVADTRRITVGGLDGLTYLSRPEDIHYRQAGDVAFTGDRLTRVYESGVRQAVVTDPEWQRQIRITPIHTDAVVVWNPGAGSGQNIQGLEPGDEDRFVCVETVIPRGFERPLPPGSTGRLGTRIEILP